ncbi:hypothetical protein BRARA_A01053 [Brassica rapa]|nr:uncharacterized protein LOC103857548 [Brassica rapa]XP_013734188.1 uncharacterized protein BNAA01G10130D [Brassica napus]KAG5413472.1 hypothetical protein IGI04_001039 [Brassica rapa subsp. trilocularis]RID78205.1 hypothetical protein BRARA_A01053 [Brassica rapa]CAF2148622.1 unnamed protein product [Brassica napus]CAG7887074.1 unnamed protein product [Brassica rapa]VDC74595.1 unnamed protein product [Brassica rapa]
MSDYASPEKSPFTIFCEYSALKHSTIQLAHSFDTKLQELRHFNRKTTTSKDELRASIRCIGRCIDSFEESFTEHAVVIDGKVDRPVVNFSEDLTNDQLRSNAKLLLKYFKKRTLRYFYDAFFPDPLDLHIDAVPKCDFIRSHLENFESLIDRVMMEAYACKTSSEDE